METILISISEQGYSNVDLKGIPNRDLIRQKAINKYTTGLIPQTSVDDSIFKTFYGNLVKGKTDITFPNTKKTTQQLQTLFNELWNGFSGEGHPTVRPRFVNFSCGVLK